MLTFYSSFNNFLCFKINNELVSSIPGTLPSDFALAVSLLKRPYYKISKKIFDTIIKNTKSDFIMYKGLKVTFGSADQGYALMPLSNQNSF